MTLGNKGWECSLREWAEVHAGAGECSLREWAEVHAGAGGCSLRERAGVHLGAWGCSLRERAGVHLGAWGCSLREPALRRFRSPGGLGSFSYASAGDQQGGASRRAPLTPGSGLLHRRFAVPSLLQDFLRTGGTRHPWREPASSRHPCRSS